MEFLALRVEFDLLCELPLLFGQSMSVPTEPMLDRKRDYNCMSDASNLVFRELIVM